MRMYVDLLVLCVAVGVGVDDVGGQKSQHDHNHHITVAGKPWSTSNTHWETRSLRAIGRKISCIWSRLRGLSHQTQLALGLRTLCHHQ